MVFCLRAEIEANASVKMTGGHVWIITCNYFYTYIYIWVVPRLDLIFVDYQKQNCKTKIILTKFEIVPKLKNANDLVFQVYEKLLLGRAALKFNISYTRN